MQRRQLLALSAAAVTTGVAGCSDSIPGTGSTEEDVSFDTDRVLDLMHAPGTFGDGDHYGFSASSPTEVDGLREDLDEEVFAQLVSEARRGRGRGGADLIRVAGVDFWDVGTRYSAGPVTAITGNFSREDIFRRLRYEGLQYQGDYNGYALIESDSDSGVTLAIEGEGRSDAEEAPAKISLVLLASDSGDTSSNAVMRETIDVAEGNGERYRDAVEPVVPLVEGLGGSALLSGETFDAVSPEEGPSGSVEHEPIEFGQPVSGTLTSDSTATINGTEYSFMDRYGFVGAAGTEAVIRAESTGTGSLAVLVYSGNDESAVLKNGEGSGEVEVTVQLSEDGPYNFIVYDPDQIRGSTGTEREYTLEVSATGGGFGGPENGVFEGEVARGSALRFEAENMVRRWVLVFEDQPSMDGVETWVSENSDEGELFGRYESVSQEADGDRAVIEGTIPLDDVETEDVIAQ